MPPKSQYELDREANIAKNRELFENLGLRQAVQSLSVPKPSNPKPVQASQRTKRKMAEDVLPRRQSRRLLSKHYIPPDETPEEKQAREEVEEKERIRLEEEKLEAEERARAAKRPRHDTLNFISLIENNDPQDMQVLTDTMKKIEQKEQPRRVQDPDAIAFDDEKKHDREVEALRKQFKDLKVVARAKVTENRIYCAAYHPEPTKDLLFFGDKHGQLGIWDARAPPDDDDEENDIPEENREGGKYWRMQLHWPATPKSSISCIKIDPIDSHNLYTSSYDCTIRSLSFVSGVSREIYASKGALISSIDLPLTGNQMWVADVDGGVTHLDLREEKTRKKRYGLSDHKIGSISLNPTDPNFLLTASNSRIVKVWDVRQLNSIPVASAEDLTPPEPLEFSSSTVTEFSEETGHKATLRGEFRHDKSASSAYWDPRGRSIVSTSYDNAVRLWNIDSKNLKSNKPFPEFAPFTRISHDCQTGKWLTILRAQWNPNPDAYSHFTIGNMRHSLDIYSYKGDLITQLADPSRISAVQAVTCSHPSVVERAASGNASGRCVLWAPA